MEDKSQKKSWFPIAGGILTIIAACACGILGILCFAFYMMYASMWWSLWEYIPFEFYVVNFLINFLTGTFMLLGVVIGLAGGIAALTRKRFVLAIVGIVFIIVGSMIGIWRLTIAFLGGPIGFMLALLLGSPPIALSILSLYFVKASREEFS